MTSHSLLGLKEAGLLGMWSLSCDDLGRAPVDISEWRVAVVEDSSGELVVVQTAGLVSVVSDQLLGQLDSLLRSEV